MIAKNLALLCILICLKVHSLDSLSTGAPSEACENMIPQHHVDPIKTDNPPFEVIYTTVKDSTNKLEVTIQPNVEGKRFKGFLLQARREWEGQAIGQWTTKEESTKAVECFGHENSAVTHNHRVNNLLKKNGFQKLTFQWTAPEDLKSIDGTILIATVAETSKIIYLNVSKIVNISEKKTDEILKDEVTEEHKEMVKDEVKEEEKKTEEKSDVTPETTEKKEEKTEVTPETTVKKEENPEVSTEKKTEQKPEVTGEETKKTEDKSEVKQEEKQEIKPQEKPKVTEKKEEEKKTEDKPAVPVEIKEEEFKKPEDIVDKDQEILRLQQEIKFLKHQLISGIKNFAK